MDIWSLRGKKVLIIDDLPDMRTMLRTLVTSLGTDDIKTAKDGEQAMALMENDKFDVVLCDYNLGEGRDGQQVLEEVRHRGLLRYTSVFIMVTAETTMPMVMGVVEYSPDDYLSKPIPKATLQTRLRKLLEKKDKLRPVLQAMQEKNPKGALVQCDRLIEEDPSSRLDLLRLKGELLLTVGDCEKARALYQSLLDMRELSWAMLGLAKALYFLQQFDRAEETLRRLIDSQPMVVAAYDLLAMVLEKQNAIKEAQRVLEQALSRSSKSIVRQRRYGEVAYRNEDYGTAEKAFKQALRVGKGSCLRGPSEFFGLTRTLVKRDAGVEAVKLAESMAREFRDDTDAQLQVAMAEAVAQKSIGNVERSQQAFERASLVFQDRPECVSSEVAMGLAEVCFQLDRADSARELLRHALRNQHEDIAMQQRVRDMFSRAGQPDEGQELINATIKEVKEINNQGVRLAQEGKLEESIRFFEKAALGMPENLQINLNAAQSLVLFMRENGVSKTYAQKAEIYLGRVQSMDVTNPKYQKLRELLGQMTAAGG